AADPLAAAQRQPHAVVLRGHANGDARRSPRVAAWEAGAHGLRHAAHYTPSHFTSRPPPYAGTRTPRGRAEGAGALGDDTGSLRPYLDEDSAAGIASANTRDAVFSATSRSRPVTLCTDRGTPRIAGRSAGRQRPGRPVDGDTRGR